ncbi:MAG: hypothetical protein NVS9B15_19310 [Acidobacteriaceae bacterium]
MDLQTASARKSEVAALKSENSLRALHTRMNVMLHSEPELVAKTIALVDEVIGHRHADPPANAAVDPGPREGSVRKP